MKMEFTDLIITLVLVFLLPSLTLILVRKAANRKTQINLPPGPWKLPFIGSLLHLVTASQPHHALRNLARSHGPVMLLRVGEIDVVVVSSSEAAQQVMQTQDANFGSHPKLSLSDLLFYGSTDILYSEGVYWRQLRRICNTDLLAAGRVSSFASIRQEEVISMLRAFCKESFDRTPVNMRTKLAEMVNNVICRSAFRERCKSQERLLEIMKQITELGSRFSFSDLFPSFNWLDVKRRRRLETIHRELDMILDDTIKEHLRVPKEQNVIDDDIEDLADALLKAKEQGDLEVPLTLDNIKAVMLDVFIAGTDTPLSTLEWAMSELMRHPTVMAKAQAEVRQAMREKTHIDENTLFELSYLKLVIKETLRLHPPVPLIPRFCKSTCKLLGYTIPSGTRLLINAWDLGRDPRYWTDANEFKPERFERVGVDFRGQNFEFVPFGAGRRICPGLLFSTVLMEMALAHILLHFDWELPDGIGEHDLGMTEGSGAFVAKRKPLCLVPILKIPLPDF
ncbi:cytochrome P450 family 71 polypeptide [Rhynchospora pubera]|uniref:Cytochrome P450 family 71 polypeptide n=1 Tax=Rhynchospora pubera TaxID=906938 RepID=A0AAV8GB95_9POAL|nr:cytochrome P450 family 71 polypeptide [Rhynchospora pubera]KAJ4802289.1 cytochrome P450 family 71 polypeptide [Rhynchospora pubera]